MSTPIRVALLTEACSAGVGKHVMDLAELLSSAGHNVHVLYSEARMDGLFAESVQRLGKLGIKFKKFRIAHGPHASDLKAILSVRRYLEANGPFQILHCHSTKAGFIGRSVAIGLDICSVYTPHALLTMSPIISKRLRLSGLIMEWSLSRLGDAIICVSAEERDYAKKIHLRKDKLFLVQNGIDKLAVAHRTNHRASVRCAFGLNENDLCIGFLGRLFPQKAPDLLLQTVAKIKMWLPESARLVFVGDGPLIGQLNEQIVTYGLQGRAILAGEMGGTEALSGFDLFVLPSWYEGFPYVLLEAMAIGLPIVTTKVGGASALVKNGVNGYVVRVGDVDAIAAALLRLVLDNGLRQQMSAASMELSKLFTLDRMAAETLSVYTAVLSHGIRGTRPLVNAKKAAV